MTETVKLKVAIYCRVSTEEQDVSKQEDELLEFCKNRGFEVFKVYKDVISGTMDSRPSLNELVQDAFQKRFNAVVIWKLDRLGRSLKHLIDVVTKFQLWGVDLICVTQQLDTSTPNGKLLFHIFGAVAEFERDMISERTKLVLKHAKNFGKRGKDKRPRKRGGYFLRGTQEVKILG
jgi:DNA invertase Pin-like site-specific DNA recombinase